MGANGLLPPYPQKTGYKLVYSIRLHNNNPGHDKVYFVSIFTCNNIDFEIIAHWGPSRSIVYLQNKLYHTVRGITTALEKVWDLYISKINGGYHYENWIHENNQSNINPRPNSSNEMKSLVFNISGNRNPVTSNNVPQTVRLKQPEECINYKSFAFVKPISVSQTSSATDKIVVTQMYMSAVPDKDELIDAVLSVTALRTSIGIRFSFILILPKPSSFIETSNGFVAYNEDLDEIVHVNNITLNLNDTFFISKRFDLSFMQFRGFYNKSTQEFWMYDFNFSKNEKSIKDLSYKYRAALVMRFIKSINYTPTTGDKIILHGLGFKPVASMQDIQNLVNAGNKVICVKPKEPAKFNKSSKNNMLIFDS